MNREIHHAMKIYKFWDEETKNKDCRGYVEVSNKNNAGYDL